MKHFPFLKKLDIKKILSSLRPSKAEGKDQSQAKNAKSFFSSDGAAVLICLLIAVCMWFYVMNFDSPIFEKEFSNIPISVDTSKLQNSISVINDDAMYVDVTVRGKRTAINSLTSADIAAYIDVSDITEAGEYLRDIKFSLPHGISIASQYPENVTAYLERRVSKTIPIDTRLTNYSIANNYIIEEELLTENVTVFGPESVIESVQNAVVTIEGGNIVGSFEANGTIVLMHDNDTPVTNRYVTTNVSNVTVKVNVYTYKTLPLQVDFKYGFYNDSNVKISISPENVKVKGRVELLSQMDYLNIATIDEKKVPSDGFSVYEIVSDDGIEIVDGITNAEVAISHIGLKTGVITCSNISAVNIPEGKNCYINSSYLNVTIRGEDRIISDLNQNDIVITADLSRHADTNGTVKVPVTVSFKNTDGATIYEVGDYRIEVTLS